jgi:hypothetical protein
MADFGKSSGVQKCTICLRKKQEATNTQVQLMKPCESPSCPFRKEIQDAIQAKQQKSKFKFGKIKKPSFTFGTKIKK